MTNNTACARIELLAPTGIPRVERDDDLFAIIEEALMALRPREGDVISVSSKLFSRAEGRFFRLSEVDPGARARELAEKTQKDPALVELILRESSAVSRAVPGVLIVRHRLGFVCANAGIDRSNAMPANAPPDSRGDWALLLPDNPQRSAIRLREHLATTQGWDLGVVITDSHGRPFRQGTTGIALGAAGIRTLDDHQARHDLDGRPLEVTVTALADQIAGAADLLAGQADEGRPLVLLRGLNAAGQGDASDLLRDPERDLYA